MSIDDNFLYTENDFVGCTFEWQILHILKGNDKSNALIYNRDLQSMSWTWAHQCQTCPIWKELRKIKRLYMNPCMCRPNTYIEIYAFPWSLFLQLNPCSFFITIACGWLIPFNILFCSEDKFEGREREVKKENLDLIFSVTEIIDLSFLVFRSVRKVGLGKKP